VFEDFSAKEVLFPKQYVLKGTLRHENCCWALRILKGGIHCKEKNNS